MRNKKSKSRIVALLVSLTLIFSFSGVGNFGDIYSYAAVNETFTIPASAGVVGGAVNIGGTNYDAHYKVISENVEAGTANIALQANGNSSYYTGASGAATLPEHFEKDDITYTVTSLGDFVFYGCQNLTNTGLGSNSTIITLGNYSFQYCTSLEDTGLGNNSTITTLGNHVFFYCQNLTDTGLGSNSTITTLGNYCFTSCDNLEDTGLGSNSTITTLGNFCFQLCVSLSEIVFPSSIISIRFAAIGGCNSLETVTFMGQTPPTLSAPLGIPATLENIIVPNGKESVYAVALKNAETNTTIKLNGLELQNYSDDGTITYPNGGIVTIGDGENTITITVPNGTIYDAVEGTITFVEGGEVVIDGGPSDDDTVIVVSPGTTYNPEEGSFEFPEGERPKFQAPIGSFDGLSNNVGNVYSYVVAFTPADGSPSGTLEYAMDDGDFQASPLFAGIAGGTSHVFKVRIKASEKFDASDTLDSSPVPFNKVHVDVSSVLISPVVSAVGQDKLLHYTGTSNQSKNKTQLAVTVLPENATVKNVVWATSDPKIATVDSQGLLTLKGKEGKVKITASATDNLTVIHSRSIDVSKHVTKLRVPLKTLYIQKGKSLTLPVASDDGKYTVSGSLKFKSSNSKILTVNTKGKITAKKVKKKAKATVTVTAKNGKSTKVTVYVVPKAVAHKGHSVKGVPKNLLVGKTAQLKIGLKKKTATTLKVTYVSSNKKVLTVDKAGKITAVKKGKAYVKVKVGKKTVKTKNVKVK